MRMTFTLLALIAPAFAASPAFAAENVTLKSDVFVQREVKDAAGKVSIVLQPPAMVTPGDRLVFVLNYRNEGDAPATDFTITNPIPPAVLYAEGTSAGGLVSADSGKSWGALASLTVRGTDGKSRAAAASDVTHVRWTLARPLPVGQGGKVQFSGVVR